MGPLGEALEEAFETSHAFTQICYVTTHFGHASLTVQDQTCQGHSRSDYRVELRCHCVD